MRRLGRMLLALVGLPCLLAGAGAAAYVGSDDTVLTRPTDLGADGRPVVTAPDLLAWDGVRVTLRAEAPDGVFIATAHPVDVADFLGDSSRATLEALRLDGVVAEDAGTGRPPPPEDADFWARELSGTGPQELRFDRDASAAQWVIAPLGGAGPTTVSFGITVDGAHAVALGVAAGGLLLLLLSVESLRPRRPRRNRRRGTPRGGPTSSPPRTGGARRATRTGRRSRATAAAVAAVLVATGCQVPRPSAEEAATLARTKVALTEQDLPALYASYDARRARAVQRSGPPGYRDGGWRRVDRGPALDMDRYETAVRRTMRLGAASSSPHTGLDVYSARFDAYPMWAMVTARPRGGDPELHLMVRDAVTAPWLMEARTAVDGDLPDAGRPAAPAGSGARDAALAARDAWSAFLASGREGDLVVDRASRAWRGAMADLGSRAIFRGWDVTTAPEDAPVRVVEVADGHLALVALRVVTRLRGRPDLAVRWNPPYARLRADEGGVLVVEELVIGLVHLPAGRRPALLGTTFSEVPAGAP